MKFLNGAVKIENYLRFTKSTEGTSFFAALMKKMAQPSSSALRALALEYKSLQEEPVEGFRVKLVNDDNLFEWEVAIFGPPDTLYQGGYFKVISLLREVELEAVCPFAEKFT